MPDSPNDVGELTSSVQDAVTQWFARNAFTTEELIEASMESEPQIEISATGKSFPNILLVGVKVGVDAPRVKMDYDVRAQFRHPFSGPVPRSMVADFVRNTGAPMLLGMVRGAIATESAIFEQGKVLLPYFLEDELKSLPDGAFVEEE